MTAGTHLVVGIVDDGHDCALAGPEGLELDNGADLTVLLEDGDLAL